MELFSRLAYHGLGYVPLTDYDLQTLSYLRNINSCHTCNRAHITDFIIIYFEHREPHTNIEYRLCIELGLEWNFLPSTLRLQFGMD